jgi:hypothetical protein
MVLNHPELSLYLLLKYIYIRMTNERTNRRSETCP